MKTGKQACCDRKIESVRVCKCVKFNHIALFFCCHNQIPRYFPTVFTFTQHVLQQLQQQLFYVGLVNLMTLVISPLTICKRSLHTVLYLTVFIQKIQPLRHITAALNGRGHLTLKALLAFLFQSSQWCGSVDGMVCWLVWTGISQQLLDGMP